MLKDLQKTIKAHHVIAFFGVVLLVWAISQYSMGKGAIGEAMSRNAADKEILAKQFAGARAGEDAPGMGGPAIAANPAGLNEGPAAVSGVTTSTQGLPPSCSRQPVADPAELLPKDTNSQWAQLNPSGAGDLKNVNLLKAGYHVGIDTVGNTLRNANLQVRSEPANPQLNVGPWNNTTIAADTMRVPLEIGCGPQ